MSSLKLYSPIQRKYMKDGKSLYLNQGFGANRVPFYSSLGLKGHSGLDLSTKRGKSIWRLDKYINIKPTENEVQGNIECVAACGGTVTSMYKDNGGGVGIKVMTDEVMIDGKWCKVEVLYYHLDTASLIMPFVEVGERVGKGKRIGWCGNTGKYTTGAHLHFQIRPHWKNGSKYIPDWNNGYNGCIDPTPFMQVSFI